MSIRKKRFLISALTLLSISAAISVPTAVILTNSNKSKIDISSVANQIYDLILKKINLEWTNIDFKTQYENELKNEINAITSSLGIVVESVEINLTNNNGMLEANPINIKFNEKVSGNLDNFNISGNMISTKNPIDTGIEFHIPIEEEVIDNIMNSFMNITIDNYKDYFENANNKPEQNNTGRLTPNLLSEITQNLLPIEAIKTINLEKSGNTDNGYLKLNLNITLNEPYQFDGQNELVLLDMETGMYDPNSEFNLSLFSVNSDDGGTNNTVIGFNWQKILDNKITNLYFPYQIQFINGKNIGTPNVQGINWDINLIAKFSQYRYQRTWATMRDAIFSKIDFSDTQFNNINSNLFRDMLNLKEAIFTNCTEFNTINIGMFDGCSKLEYIDMSGATIETIQYLAFNNCVSLKTILVKDEASKQIVQNAINDAHLVNVEIIIK